MADARTAFLITIDPEHEGGFQKDPDDSGNWTGGEVGKGTLVGTKYGISAAQFPNLDIFNLTPGDAIQIYVDTYWKTYYSQISNQLVANKLADCGVLFGVGEAIKLLQAALGVGIDGDFGPETLAKVNELGVDQESLLNAYKTVLVKFATEIGAHQPEKREFVSGWIRRINS